MVWLPLLHQAQSLSSGLPVALVMLMTAMGPATAPARSAAPPAIPEPIASDPAPRVPVSPVTVKHLAPNTITVPPPPTSFGVPAQDDSDLFAALFRVRADDAEDGPEDRLHDHLTGLGDDPMADLRMIRAALRKAPSEGELATEAVSRVAMSTLSAEWSWLLGITARTDAAQLWSGPFQLPVSGVVTSPFGVVRSDEGLPSTPHRGLDMGAPSGAAVVATNAGVVIFTGPLAVRGNAVIINHGHGVFSGYYHLSNSTVESGQKVQAGDVIAAVGHTGLSTGPHLHWDMIVQGVHTDPLTWVGRTGVPDANQKPVTVLASGLVIPDAPIYPEPTPEELAEATGADTDDEALAEDEETDEPGKEKANPTATATAGAKGKATATATAAAKEKEKAAAAAKRAARAEAVRTLYVEMLNRDPTGADETGVGYWTDSKLTLEQMRQELVVQAAEERRLQVRRIYVDVLGRDPTGADDASLTSWAASSMTVKELRKTIIKDGLKERTVRVRGIYMQLLGRDPSIDDKVSLESWVSSDLTIAQIKQRIMATEEYKAKAAARDAAPAPAATDTAAASPSKDAAPAPAAKDAPTAPAAQATPTATVIGEGRSTTAP